LILWYHHGSQSCYSYSEKLGETSLLKHITGILEERRVSWRQDEIHKTTEKTIITVREK